MLLKNRTSQEYLFGNGFCADMLFCNLPPKSLEFLTRVKHKKQFQKGTAVISEGDLPQCVYVLLRGQAQVLLKKKLNEQTVVRFVEPNEIFGLTEAISNSPFEISVETISPCLFEIIARRDFISFLHNDSSVCFRLVQLLGFNIQKSYYSFGLR